MKANKKLFIAFLLIFLFSCSTKEKKQENALYEVKIAEAIQNNPGAKLSDLAAGKVTYIQLDSDKIHLLDKTFGYYLNGKEIIAFANKQIFVFDSKTGKFLREIGHYGKDPGGYRKVLESFSFDEEKQLVYTGGWDPKSYYRYAVDGSLFDKVTAWSIDKEGDIMDNVFGEMVTSIAPLNDTCFVGYVWNINGKQEAKLIVFSKKNHRIKIYPQYNHFDYDIKRDGISVFRWNAKYYQLNHQLHFYERNTDTLLTATIDTLHPKFILRRGEAENVTATNLHRQNGKIPYAMIDNIFESERYLFFKAIVVQKSDKPKYFYGFYDKKERTTSVSPDEVGIENDIDKFIPMKFYSVNNNNDIIGALDAYEVRLWFDENPEKAAQLPPELQKLKNIKETDNPLVMIAKLKD